jgi:hypothetical protein
MASMGLWPRDANSSPISRVFRFGVPALSAFLKSARHLLGSILELSARRAVRRTELDQCDKKKVCCGHHAINSDAQQVKGGLVYFLVKPLASSNFS